jgi:phage shock protein A
VKSKSFVRIVTGIGIVLLVASAVSQGLELKHDKVTVESRVTALENKVALLESKVAFLENKVIELEKQIANPPVRIVPCK